jgi:hypothetical protein
MKRLMVLGLAGLLSVGVLAACGDDDDDGGSVQGANAEFCQNLAAYGTAVADLAALNPTATKADYSSAADTVKSTREDLESSAASLAQAEWTNLKTQADTLKDQLKDAPDDQAVAGILTDAIPQAVKVQASVATVNTAVCTASNTSTTTG